MPTWGKLLAELTELQKAAQEGRPVGPQGEAPQDTLRRKYLKSLTEHTGRAALLYATPWLENREVNQGASLTINLGDVQGFMEACSNITERHVDLILTSPGGSPEAADSIMAYLRTRFDHIRAVIPVAAMSAATMMALACDEILMGSHSQLGPIDPQFTLITPEGPRSSPGQAILDQFELAKQECRDPANIGAWLPLLRSLLPGLLAQCRHQRDLAEQFAATALETYMFAGDAEGKAKAQAAAAWFSDFSTFRSHGRRVSRDDALDLKLEVKNLEDDQVLQDRVLSVHHATRHTFNTSNVTKIIENHHGRTYIEQIHVQIQVNRPTPPGSPISPPRQQPVSTLPRNQPSKKPPRSRRKKS